MTAASAYPPESSEGRPSEPSMEDILASIRRIIADDQNQGGKAASTGNGSRRPVGQAAEEDRATPARARSPYDDVLDLARLVPSGDRAGQHHGDGEGAAAPYQVPVAQAYEAPTPVSPFPAAAEPRAASTDVAAVQPAVDHDHDRLEPLAEVGQSVSSLRARLPEPAGRSAAQEDHDMLDHPVPALSDESEEDLLSAPLGASVMSAFETLAATVVLQNTPMLERVMRDLLRPMLKTWLDDNLPGLVERLVRGEIERVARGGRG